MDVSASTRRPRAMRPGPHTIAGTRTLDSNIVHFWLCPWSPSASPWSEVKITTVSSSTPRASRASSSAPTSSSIIVTLAR